MAGNDNETPSEFAEFMEWMTAKKQAEADAQTEDEEVEIWNSKGEGARVKRSVAKPFLQSLGIDLDPTPDTSGDSKDKDKPGKKPATGRTAQNAATTGQGTIRKYFTK